MLREFELESFEVLLSEDRIHKRVRELASQISSDYQDTDNLLLVGILKGAYVFMADLHREIDPAINAQVDFMRVSSYGSGTISSGQPRIDMDLSTDIEGKNVILVEDIVDTGYSMKTLLAILGSRRPVSLKVCVLLSKPDRREVDINIDYLGFTIPNVFVFGYGLDANQEHRGLKEIIFKK